MVRLHWVKTIIELANNGDSRVQIWKKTKKDKTKLYIRYIYLEIDYVLIFAVKPDQYIFITAYPVYFIDSKNDFKKDYEKFMRQKIKSR